MNKELNIIGLLRRILAFPAWVETISGCLHGEKHPKGWDYLVDSAEKIDEEEKAMGKVAGKERQR